MKTPAKAYRITRGFAPASVVIGPVDVLSVDVGRRVAVVRPEFGGQVETSFAALAGNPRRAAAKVFALLTEREAIAAEIARQDAESLSAAPAAPNP